ncbi:MAG: hypothetical protein WBP44_03150 [Gammaproteobacteria bacterium]
MRAGVIIDNRTVLSSASNPAAVLLAAGHHACTTATARLRQQPSCLKGYEHVASI